MINYRKKEYVVSWINEYGYESKLFVQALDENDAFEKFVSVYGDNYLINFINESSLRE